MVSPSSRQAEMSKKSTSSFLERTRFTAMPKEHTGTPARVKRSSGSRVRLPPKTTRLKLTMSISLLRNDLALVRSWPLVTDYTRGEVFPTGTFHGGLRRSYSAECLERLYEKSSNTGEPPRHEANHGSVHQRFAARTKPFVVFAHPPLLVDP